VSYYGYMNNFGVPSVKTCLELIIDGFRPVKKGYE